MVEQAFLDKFRTVLATLTESRGPVNLFAILKMDELTDKWTVVLSAEWLHEDNRDETFYYLRDLILGTLETKEAYSIARIGLFRMNEHLIELMLDRYRADDYIERDEQVNGNIIHEGYIFVSSKSAVKH